MNSSVKCFSSNTSVNGFNLLVAGFPQGDKKKQLFTDSMTPKCWIIEYVIKGKGFLDIPPFKYYPGAGSLYILPKQGQPYSYYADPDAPWHKACLLLDGELVERLLDAYGLKGKLFFTGCEDTLEIFKQIYSLKSTAVESQYEALVLVNQLFCCLRGKIAGVNGTIATRKGHADGAAKLWEYLNECELDISIDEYCKSHRLNKSSLIRTFRKRYGVTPYAFLMSCRVARAQALLRFSSLPLKEIASRLLFTDQYHFSAYFKKKKGISPSEYRNNPL